MLSVFSFLILFNAVVIFQMFLLKWLIFKYVQTSCIKTYSPKLSIRLWQTVPNIISYISLSENSIYKDLQAIWGCQTNYFCAQTFLIYNQQRSSILQRYAAPFDCASTPPNFKRSRLQVTSVSRSQTGPQSPSTLDLRQAWRARHNRPERNCKWCDS